MRLINVYSLELKEFVTNIPRYAILTHRWSDDEITLKEYRKNLRLERNQRVGSIGYKKVEQFCEFVRTLWRDGPLASLFQTSLQTTEVKLLRPVEWVWIDTVCIDKHSSAELSEAINSMYEWYYNAAVCVAYLADVPRRNPRLQPLVRLSWMYDYLGKSEWFSRG